MTRAAVPARRRSPFGGRTAASSARDGTAKRLPPAGQLQTPRYTAEWLIEMNSHRGRNGMRAAWHDQTFTRAA